MKTKYTFYGNGSIKTSKTYDKDGSLLYTNKYNKYGYETELVSYTTCSSSEKYLNGYYYGEDYEKAAKEKVASDVHTYKYTYSNEKTGLIKYIKESVTYKNESGKKVTSLSYKNKVTDVYYTSGYRKGWIKFSTNCTYTYKADKTNKNVGVKKCFYNGELISRTVYTWTKISK